MFKTKIGSGAQADIFLHNGAGIKLFREGYETSYAVYEKEITETIAKTGLPIANMTEVFRVDNRIAIRMDYIPGEPLGNRMQKEPQHIVRYLNQMARLQLDMHTKKPILPFTYKQRLRNSIQSCDNIPSDIKSDLFNTLAHLPDGNGLCHGDFHPGNLLIQGETLFIIDWIDASSGCPSGDVCRSYLLFLLYFPEAADVYLDCYCEMSGLEKQEVLAWLPVIAAARMKEGNQAELETLFGWITNR